jgi:transposase-like protein
MKNPFRYFNFSPEIIRLTVMMYVRYPLSLRQVEDLLFERGIDICHETVRFWCKPFRSDVRRGDQETARSSLLVFELALAPGRGVREDQWGDALPVTCR